LYGHVARSVEEARHYKDCIIAGGPDRIIISNKYEIASSGGLDDVSWRYELRFFTLTASIFSGLTCQ
jgi:hypothetical protein